MISKALYSTILLALFLSVQLQADILLCSPQVILGFEQAVEEILMHAFELKAVEAECSARDAEIWQAAARPNPELSVSLDNIGSNICDDENSFTVEMTQLLELGGKRSARIRVANAQKQSTCLDVEIMKCALFAEVLHAFIDVASAQERLELAKSQEALSHQAFQCLSIQKNTGKSSAIEAKKAEVICRSAKLKLAKQKAALQQSIKQLIVLWDCQPPKFDKVSFPLFELSSPPPFENLFQLLCKNPVLAKAEAEFIKSQEIFHLERSLRIPDLAVQVGVSTDRIYRDPGLNIGIDISLPLFDRNEGNINRASYESLQAYYNQKNAMCHLKTELAGLYEDWMAAYDEAITLRDGIVPAANESFNLAQESYDDGKFDYLHLLDAKSTLFEVQEQYLDAVEEYHHKRAEILKITAQCCPYANS